MSESACPQCGVANDSANLFCIQCGLRLEPEEEGPAGGSRPEQSESDLSAREGPGSAEDTTHPERGEGLGGSPTRIVQAEDEREQSTPGEAGSDRGSAPRGTRLFVSRPIVDRARVTRLLPGGEADQHEFEEALVIGRAEGDLLLPDDPYLSVRHASIRREGRRYVLEDLGSTNGTFVRTRTEVELRPGDRILIGGQILEFVV